MAPSLDHFQAGVYRKQLSYQSFLPNPICSEWQINSPTLIHLLSEADRALGELNGLSLVVPDVDFFIAMHIAKEATTSSRIEGTQTSIEEALLSREDIAPEKRADWDEVRNYIDALNQAIADLEQLPLSGRLLRQTHATLMRGVRGEHKQPGEFRKAQNWIGGATLADAVFVPPHASELPDLMGDLERFLNDHSHPIPHLIRIGMAHYQFETIHPFNDGNGRLGRLMITLYLVGNGLLHKPTLYLSDFLERHRSLYYDNLMSVRTSNQMEQWLKFFLVGVTETSRNAITTFRSILTLREEVEYHTLATLGRKTAIARRLMHLLYKSPIVSIVQVAEGLEISRPSASSLIEEFCRLGILQENTGYKRNKIFIFYRYLNIFLPR